MNVLVHVVYQRRGQEFTYVIVHAGTESVDRQEQNTKSEMLRDLLGRQ
jgi:hypothetical protein